MDHVTWEGSQEDLDYIESKLNNEDYNYEKIDDGLGFQRPRRHQASSYS